MTPKYSIIVPVYNAEATLRRCVDSILSQTYTDFELILVNDGSTDNSQSILDAYVEKDRRMRSIRKSNGGVSSARNVGLDIAKGEWVLFVDADDEVKSGWILEFDKLDSSADLGIQGINFIGQNKTVRHIGNGYGNRNFIKTAVSLMLANGILGYNWSKKFRREIIERNRLRYDTNLRFREDDVFTLKYCEYANSWASTSKSEYIYYMPTANKQYGTSPTKCTEQIHSSLNKIFNGQIPDDIKKSQIWSVKGAAIDRLLAGEKLTHELITIYKDIVIPYSVGIKAKILNNIIINSLRFPQFSSITVRLIHLFLSRD